MSDTNILLLYEIWEDYKKWVERFKMAHEQYKLGNDCSWSWLCSDHGITGLEDVTPFGYAKSKNTKYSGTIPVNPNLSQENHEQLLETIENHGKTIKEGFEVLCKTMKEMNKGGSAGSNFNIADYRVTIGGRIIPKNNM